MGWTFYASGNGPTTAAAFRDEVIADIEREQHGVDGYRVKVVAHGTTSAAFYLACKLTPLPGAALPDWTEGIYVPDADGTVTAAHITLYKRDSGFGRKDLGETSGPTETEAPQKVMQALSALVPLSEADLAYVAAMEAHRRGERGYPFPGDVPGCNSSRVYAHEWRSRVRAGIEHKARLRQSLKRVVPGATIKLAHPANFGSGIGMVETFTVTTYHSRGKAKRAFLTPGGAKVRLTDRNLQEHGFEVL